MTVFAATVRDGVCRLARPGSRWLSTGPTGGRTRADAAYNVTVPAEWGETDLAAYARARRERAGLADPTPGPTLFTAVPQRRARRARLDGVEAVVTAGLSNPAAVRVPPTADASADSGADPTHTAATTSGSDAGPADGSHPDPGTVNVVVGTDRTLAPGALAGLLAAAVEARAATLLSLAGVPGTTTDAVAAACDPGGGGEEGDADGDGPDADRRRFAGSATPVGRAARACVRDALRASLDAGDDPPPASVADAEHGVVVDETATVSRL